MENFVKMGYAKEQKGKISIDLGAAGYDKLLGSGSITKSLEVTVDYATQRAISKIEQAGGSVVSESEDAMEETQEAE